MDTPLTLYVEEIYSPTKFETRYVLKDSTQEEREQTLTAQSIDDLPDILIKTYSLPRLSLLSIKKDQAPNMRIENGTIIIPRVITSRELDVIAQELVDKMVSIQKNSKIKQQNL